MRTRIHFVIWLSIAFFAASCAYKETGDTKPTPPDERSKPHPRRDPETELEQDSAAASITKTNSKQTADLFANDVQFDKLYVERTSKNAQDHVGAFGWHCLSLSGLNRDPEQIFESISSMVSERRFSIMANPCKTVTSVADLWAYAQSDDLGSEDRLMVVMHANGKNKTSSLDSSDVSYHELFAVLRKIAKQRRVFFSSHSSGSGELLRLKLLFDKTQTHDPSVQNLCLHSDSVFQNFVYPKHYDYLSRINPNYSVSAEELFELRPEGVLSSAGWTSVGFTKMLEEYSLRGAADLDEGRQMLQRMALHARLLPYDAVSVHDNPFAPSSNLFPKRSLNLLVPQLGEWNNLEDDMSHANKILMGAYRLTPLPLEVFRNLKLEASSQDSGFPCLLAFSEYLGKSGRLPLWKLTRLLRRFSQTDLFKNKACQYKTDDGLAGVVARWKIVHEELSFQMERHAAWAGYDDVLKEEVNAMGVWTEYVNHVQNYVVPHVGELAWEYPPHDYPRYVDLTKVKLNQHQQVQFKQYLRQLVGDESFLKFESEKDQEIAIQLRSRQLIEEFVQGSIKATRFESKLDRKRRGACRNFELHGLESSRLSQIIDNANLELTKLSKESKDSKRADLKKLFERLEAELYEQRLSETQRRALQQYFADVSTRDDEYGSRWRHIEMLRQMLRDLRTVLAFH